MKGYRSVPPLPFAPLALLVALTGCASSGGGGGGGGDPILDEEPLEPLPEDDGSTTEEDSTEEDSTASMPESWDLIYEEENQTDVGQPYHDTGLTSALNLHRVTEIDSSTLNGSGALILVGDGGIDPESATALDPARANDSASFSVDPETGEFSYTADGGTPWSDDSGHGSKVGQLAFGGTMSDGRRVGVAPGAEYASGKILYGEDGTGPISGIASFGRATLSHNTSALSDPDNPFASGDSNHVERNDDQNRLIDYADHVDVANLSLSVSDHGIGVTNEDGTLKTGAAYAKEGFEKLAKADVATVLASGNGSYFPGTFVKIDDQHLASWAASREVVDTVRADGASFGIGEAMVIVGAASWDPWHKDNPDIPEEDWADGWHPDDSSYEEHRAESHGWSNQYHRPVSYEEYDGSFDGEEPMRYENASETRQRIADRYIVAKGTGLEVENQNAEILKVDGSSGAAPLVAGTLGLIRAEWDHLNAKEATNIVLDSAQDIGREGTDLQYGVGVLDVEAALSPIGSTFVPTGDTVDGDSVELRETQAIAPAEYGDALERASLTVAVFDDYERDFEIELATGGAPTTTGLPGPGGALLSQAQPTENTFVGFRSFGAEASNLTESAVNVPRFDGGTGIDLRGATEYGDFRVLGLRDEGHRSWLPDAKADTGVLLRHTLGIGHGLSMGLDAGQTSEGTGFTGALATREAESNLLGTRLRWDAEGADLHAVLTVHMGDTETRGALSAETTDRAWRLGFGGDRWGVALHQPLRAEGTASWNRPVGRTTDGQVVYETQTIDLAPSGQERALRAHQAFNAGPGEFRLDGVYRHEPGHVAGAEPDWAVNAGYSMSW